MSDVDSLPVNKLQTKPLLWSFLPLQGTNQLLLELWQVLLIHLQTETGESDGFLTAGGSICVPVT